eukprot:comp22205_c0_seq1/m.52427 comp22205_c0_seq1/g.52427  ORF comp22205_c0_seq1/g.52427 comp22205_c0_seq1/m.52427 type:complete len:390 (+) comp22205_c0_seq1:1429-2598(+)
MVQGRKPHRVDLRDTGAVVHEQIAHGRVADLRRKHQRSETVVVATIHIGAIVDQNACNVEAVHTHGFMQHRQTGLCARIHIAAILENLGHKQIILCGNCGKQLLVVSEQLHNILVLAGNRKIARDLLGTILALLELIAARITKNMLHRVHRTARRRMMQCIVALKVLLARRCATVKQLARRLGHTGGTGTVQRRAPTGPNLVHFGTIRAEQLNNVHGALGGRRESGETSGGLELVRVRAFGKQIAHTVGVVARNAVVDGALGKNFCGLLVAVLERHIAREPAGAVLGALEHHVALALGPQNRTCSVGGAILRRRMHWSVIARIPRQRISTGLQQARNTGVVAVAAGMVQCSVAVHIGHRVICSTDQQCIHKRKRPRGRCSGKCIHARLG